MAMDCSGCNKKDEEIAELKKELASNRERITGLLIKCKLYGNTVKEMEKVLADTEKKEVKDERV